MKIVIIISSLILIIVFLTKTIKTKPKRKQTHNKKIPFKVEFIIDSKGKTLQEVQEERKKMKKILLQSL